MTLSPGTRLGSYEILSPLGAGGMGEVYRALDGKLGRMIAVKILPERFANDPEAVARFEREAFAVAALSHPNILAIYDFGRERGITFAVMELLDGETLRERLAAGPLSPRRVADYAAQIAQGLAAAHARGVVHRDLKPENVFVTRDDFVKILDFGLASRRLEKRPLDGAEKREQAAVSDHPVVVNSQEAIPTETLGERLTDPGVVLGTVGYMSPEQARGQPSDARSDIFSFGTVLFEMLSGARPFRGDSAAETLTAILRDEPPELPEPVRHGAPALERIARRCLEKDPERRFQLARDLAFAIEVVAGISPRRPTAPAAAAAGGVERRRSVAVLFFKDLSGSSENAHLGLGLADATITELSRVKSLLVRPTASILRYRDRSVSPEEAGRELAVDAVVDGSFQRSGSRLRVTVQLVSSADGRSLWGSKIDTSLDDIFQMQDEVSRRIVEALQVELSPADEKRLARPQRPAGHVHELYMKGRAHLFSETLEDVNRAIESFEKALEEDPAFTLALVGLGNAYARMAFTYDPAGDWFQKAEVMCARALAIEPSLPEGRYLKGLLAWTPQRGFDHADAIREYMAAIAGNPNLSEAHERMGVLLMHVAMLPESSAHSSQAMAINPNHRMARVHMGLLRYLEGRYQEALEMSTGSESPWSNYQIALCQLRLGDFSRAARTAERGARRLPGDPAAHSLRGLIAASRGDADEARRQVELIVSEKRSFGHFHHLQYDIACIHALLGEKAAALDVLTQAAKNGFPCYPFFAVDPLLESLREEQGFAALMAELKDECDGYRRLYAELQSSVGSDSSGHAKR